MEIPLFCRFDLCSLVMGIPLNVVHSPQPFGRRVPKQLLYGRIGEQTTATGSVACIVKLFGYYLFSPVFEEQFVHQLPDRGILLVYDKLLFLTVGAGPPRLLPSCARIGIEAATRAAISSRSHWAMAAIMV